MTGTIKALTSTFVSVLDMYLTGTLRSTRSQRAPKAGSSRGRLVLWGVLCVQAVAITPSNAYGVKTEIDYLKLYAHSRIVNYKEWQCFNHLITKESGWRVTARNGSHYGLGQMRNKRYRVLDGYSQIDWSLRYITKRHQTPCKALRFFDKKGFH